MSLRLLHRVSCGLLAALLLPGFSSCFAQGTSSDRPLAAARSASTPDLTAASEKGSAYKIGVGDVLHITVWEEPQFTEVAAARLEKYVHKPRVTVTVQDIRSRMVYVTGEVQRPGAYPLIDTMTVVQLIARSGGPTDFAKKNKVYVLRAGNSARINVDYRKVLRGQSPEQNVELAPGDTVVVP